ncbi:MAG: dTDP-4-dehydrorhamnose reductase [Actinomycetota bacterium]|nr:dTDP-4-dehydrorhamnose reductase [Actinomycetota bacterium]
MTASPLRILVTGAGGQVGSEVAAHLPHHQVIALDRTACDLSDRHSVEQAVAAAAPAAVVNCAAWTDVDGCEADPERAVLVNALGVRHLAAACARAGAHLVHVSTDYVFSGDATEPYPEDAPTGPIGAYGRSKLAGEIAVIDAAPSGHAIVRTAWIFGPHGKNFVDTMLRLGAERDELTVVDDQLGCPTYTGHLAPALVEIAVARSKGVLHVAGGGSCTWWELACATFERAGLSLTVHRGTTAGFNAPAPRPGFSVLGSTRSDAPVLPAWQDGLAAHLIAREVLAS